MKTKIIKKPLFIFTSAIFISFSFFACSDDSPSGPEGDSDFDFSADLIAFRSERDGQQELYLMTTDGAKKNKYYPKRC
jgi:hypothetical protein